MIKMALFDLDGTLADTLTDLANSCNYALTQHGCPVHPDESYKQFVGNGAYILMKRIIPPGVAATDELICTLKQDFDRHYAAHFCDYTKAYDGIIELLDRMGGAGIQLAVLSNKPHRFTCEVVHKLFSHRFQYVMGQQDGIPHKPDPTAVFRILAEAGVKAEDCIYVGDSGVDMETAGNAGMVSYGVLWGFRSQEELVSHGAAHIVGSAQELWEKLQR